MNRVSLVFSFLVLKIFHHSKFSWCADEEWLGKFYETVASFCCDCGDIVLREKILRGQLDIETFLTSVYNKPNRSKLIDVSN